MFSCQDKYWQNNIFRLGRSSCRNSLLETLQFRTVTFILGSLSKRLQLFINIIGIEFQISSGDSYNLSLNVTSFWVLDTILKMLFNSHLFKTHLPITYYRKDAASRYFKIYRRVSCLGYSDSVLNHVFLLHPRILHDLNCVLIK